MMTWTAWQVGHERNYYMRVTSCNDRNVVGQTDDGESVRLTFPFFQNRQWGELPQVQTINATGGQNLRDFNSVCQVISEQHSDSTIRFETNGLNKIQRVWFLAASTETTTELWAIYGIDGDVVTFRQAEWIDDTDTNTPFWSEETTTNTKQIESDTFTIKLLCYSESCRSDAPDDIYTTLRFETFLEVRTSCLNDPTSCPYYDLSSTPHVFDVVLDSSGNILQMAQRYIP